MSSLRPVLLRAAIAIAALGALRCNAPSDAAESSKSDAASAMDANDANDGGVSCKPSHDAGPLIRQFTVLSYPYRPFPAECQNGTCDGGTCYHLSKELSVCDQAQPDPYTGDCTQPASGPELDFECGCDGGTCAGDRICAALEYTCSCAPSFYSKCVEPACTSASDCPAGTVCVPASMIGDARCVEATCTRDSDCDAGCAGRCAALYKSPQQGGEWQFFGMHCVYEDGPGEHACPDGGSLYPTGYCP